MKNTSDFFMVLTTIIPQAIESKDRNDTVEAYTHAWYETDSVARLKSIKTFWSENGIYQDPSSLVKGAEQLNEMITNFQKKFPGVYFEDEKCIDTGNYRTSNWQMYTADKKLVLRGRDFIEFDATGKILKVIGFFEQ